MHKLCISVKIMRLDYTHTDTRITTDQSNTWNGTVAEDKIHNLPLFHNGYVFNLNCFWLKLFLVFDFDEKRSIHGGVCLYMCLWSNKHRFRSLKGQHLSFDKSLLFLLIAYSNAIKQVGLMKETNIIRPKRWLSVPK